MKRIFAAIEISAAARERVYDYIENLRGEFSSQRVGWEKPEKLHLTLKFFGDIEEKQLRNLIGVRDEQGSLAKTNDILESECENRGLAREKRIFKPHLTIARLREPHKSINLVRFHTNKNFTLPSFKVSGLIVLQSRIYSDGSRYTPIFRANFDTSGFPIDINFAEE
jgi:2'-5' RNA ligase